jgi:hypothetical protein
MGARIDRLPSAVSSLYRAVCGIGGTVQGNKKGIEMQRGTTICAGALLLVLMTTAAQAQEFSADVVYTNAKKQDASEPTTGPSLAPSSRLYVSQGKMRFESKGMSTIVMLVDDVNHTTVALFPEQKSYRELGSRPSQYFRPTDAENACPDWQKAAGKQLTCLKVGDDTFDGRKTVKYKSSNPDGSASYIWIDPKLDYVVKWQMGNTGAELHNIKEAPQSADLFVIPQGYEVLKPRKRARGK